MNAMFLFKKSVRWRECVCHAAAAVVILVSQRRQIVCEGYCKNVRIGTKFWCPQMQHSKTHRTLSITNNKFSAEMEVSTVLVCPRVFNKWVFLLGVEDINLYIVQRWRLKIFSAVSNSKVRKRKKYFWKLILNT
jgi:hypothetical protein